MTTYPNLTGLFENLEIETEPSNMSFSFTMNNGQFEWSSDSLFCQFKNILNFNFWKMIIDILRFGKCAPNVLKSENNSKYQNMTLNEYITEGNYSQMFKERYLLPMCAAVWSVPFEEALKFPVYVLVQFWLNHHLLDIFQRPRWRIVKGRSQAYVQKIING